MWRCNQKSFVCVFALAFGALMLAPAIAVAQQDTAAPPGETAARTAPAVDTQQILARLLTNEARRVQEEVEEWRQELRNWEVVENALAAVVGTVAAVEPPRDAERRRLQRLLNDLEAGAPDEDRRETLRQFKERVEPVADVVNGPWAAWGMKSSRRWTRTFWTAWKPKSRGL